MGGIIIPGVKVTPLKIIAVPEGDVLHAAKCFDDGISGFGEAYFSTIKKDHIKAWKRHREMTLNLIVPVGEIKFVIYDDRPGSACYTQKQVITLSINNYKRVTVPPMVWMGFMGMAEGMNLLLNIADRPHNPDESDRAELMSISHEW